MESINGGTAVYIQILSRWVGSCGFRALGGKRTDRRRNQCRFRLQRCAELARMSARHFPTVRSLLTSSRTQTIWRLLPLLAILTAASVDADWQGFDAVLPIDSGLLAPFTMDFRYTVHLHVGGAAAADINGDGWADLVITRGENSPLLFLNDGDGSFSNHTVASGLGALSGIYNGVLLADVDADGHRDLLLGGVSSSDNIEAPHTAIRLFLNDGSARFTDHTEQSNLVSAFDSQSMSLGDVDGDGLVDLMITFWQHGEGSSSGHLWRNLGGGQFEDVSQSSGIGGYYSGLNSLFNFTSQLADLDSDGWLDLMVAADFGRSRVFLNQANGTFSDATDSAVITDENGMGSTVGDFDNDGDLDWFVTSIWEDTSESRPYGITGNRLYRNDGQGSFDDATDEAGVRAGGWGWGSCSADFNNDGWLDLFMVNGYQTHIPRFLGDAARLFINDGDGSFSERAADMGIDSTGQGRAVVCFDSDNDGWIDVLIQNSHASGETSVLPQFYRNSGDSDARWLSLRLSGPPGNRDGIGARITLTTASGSQMREIRAGGSFLASSPALAHFGLGNDARVDRIDIRWPDGRISTRYDVESNRILEVRYDTLHGDRFE